jgi:hypothetical protein
MGSLHFSALVELMGGVATATAAVGGTEGGMDGRTGGKGVYCSFT